MQQEYFTLFTYVQSYNAVLIQSAQQHLIILMIIGSYKCLYVAQLRCTVS